ncbi:hypothetical protein [Rhodoplanes azumiensis]|uniref:Uncharacterized protein n=1 Tax=Rhodoplanes azumiensis TaxID=1897628 RepID=A0ABW5AF01_9BRAD
MRTGLGRAELFEERIATDAVGFAEATIAGLLAFVGTSTAAKRKLGLKAVSRRADGWPAWYVWLAGRTDAFELVLVPCDDGGSTLVDGIELAIRCFPDPADETVFPTFTAWEQEARTSAVFDRTGTPAVSAVGDLDPSLYHVGTIRLVPRAGGWLDLTLFTQDVWCEIETSACGPRRRRSVPGTALSAPIVDLLVCAHALVGRQSPAGIEIRSAPGLVWHLGRGESVTVRPDPDLSALEIRVTGLPRFGVPLDRQRQALPRPDDAVGGRLRLWHAGSDRPPEVGPFDLASWWEAAGWRLPPIGAMCGCHAGEVGVAGRDEPAPSRPPFGEGGRA